jgi:hypothetical protein
MTIPNQTLNLWSHAYSAEAPKQTQMAIREALDTYEDWLPGTIYEVFLQGSYKNDTNLRQDSDVDVVVRLDTNIQPKIASLTGSELEENEAHKIAHGKWKSFRAQVFKALTSVYDADVTTGRKTITLKKGKLQASADVVVTIQCGDGIAIYIPDEHRWAVSYPKQRYKHGVSKEEATQSRYKRTIRMFKAARKQLVKSHLIKSGLASSYYIECLMSNVPDRLFKVGLGDTYQGIVKYLSTADLRQFKSQNGFGELFGIEPDLWNIDDAQRFIKALGQFWDNWSLNQKVRTSLSLVKKGS